MQVSHLHPIQQRLVAHHVLINTDHADTLETAGLVDQETLPFGQDRIVGGVPSNSQRLGDRSHGQVVDHEGFQRPAQCAA